MENSTLANTAVYHQAMAALQQLKRQYGLLPELRDLAQLLVVCHDAVPTKERVFPFVGDPNDARDQAVVRAFKTELQRLINADDPD